MVTMSGLRRCKLCGGYLTIAEEFTGSCCTDPAHWLAVGMLAPTDFYKMARVEAMAHRRQSEQPSATAGRSLPWTAHR